LIDLTSARTDLIPIAIRDLAGTGDTARISCAMACMNHAKATTDPPMFPFTLVPE
jgi:hypothetical protein